MYTRFIRWASDRLGDEGIIALVVGRKPISKGAYNGFRKVIADEFYEVLIIDLGADFIENPEPFGYETSDIAFGLKFGVAIIFLVRRLGALGCSISFVDLKRDSEDKLAFLATTQLHQLNSSQWDRTEE